MPLVPVAGRVPVVPVGSSKELVLALRSSTAPVFKVVEPPILILRPDMSPKMVLPILSQLLVLDAGVSTLLLLPIRIFDEPVVSVVLATAEPITTLLLPVVIVVPDDWPRAVL